MSQHRLFTGTQSSTCKFILLLPLPLPLTLQCNPIQLSPRSQFPPYVHRGDRIAFGDSYNYIQGTAGRQNYSFIGDYLPGNFSFSPETLLSDKIVANYSGTSAGGTELDRVPHKLRRACTRRLPAGNRVTHPPVAIKLKMAATKRAAAAAAVAALFESANYGTLPSPAQTTPSSSSRYTTPTRRPW